MERNGWPESSGISSKDDLERFKALNWGIRTWDLWNWNDCLPREIHVDDSEAYFTGTTGALEMIGLAVFPLSW